MAIKSAENLSKRLKVEVTWVSNGSIFTALHEDLSTRKALLIENNKVLMIKSAVGNCVGDIYRIFHMGYVTKDKS